MAENVNFLPEDYLERRLARRTNIICLTLFAVVMVGLVSTFFVSGRQAAEVRAEHAEVNREFEEAARRIEQLEQLQRQKTQMLHKARISSVLVERVPRSLLMAELINHMPLTVSLLDLELSTRTVRSTPRPRTSLQQEQEENKDKERDEFAIEVPETEMTLMLVGVAPTDVEVAQFMSSLGRHHLFQDVNLQYSEQTTVNEQEARQFRIEMVVDQEVNLRDVEPTMVSRELEQDPMRDQIELGGGEAMQLMPAEDLLQPIEDE